MQKRRFELTSQDWSPNAMLEPTAWKHAVDIYIPTNAFSGRALIVANNGTNSASAQGGTRPPTDFTEETIMAIARKTSTIIISVSDVPNQYLTYLDDGIARREDSSVAHSWKLFMQSPKTRPFMSLHVPMMSAIVKTMDLAEKELQPWKVQKFIATGASKRGWGAWLAAIADTRIEAIAPFVIDVLGMDKMLEHTYRTYGESWPLAFADYHREGFTAQRKTQSADQLLQIEDPLRYLDSPYAQRLSIPKYIINASGDDFFVPDSSQFYFDQLPGMKALRVVPNSDHAGIRNYAQDALVTLLHRLQRAQELPQVDMQWTAGDQKHPGNTLQLNFSEMPVRLVQWTAHNPVTRDFRYACGIRYAATPMAAAQNVTVSMQTPEHGWQSSFVEAQFADGFVMTTPVRILPESYPAAPGPVLGNACRTVH